MDQSQIQPTQDPHNTGLQSVIEDENDQQKSPGKTSVMKKMKAKAKKLKHSVLSKHTHGNDQPDNETDALKVSDDNDEFYDEDDDEDVVDEPEIHGAPIYDSPAVKTDVAGGNYGKEGVPQLPTSTPPVSREFHEGSEGGLVGRSTKLEEDPRAPNSAGNPPIYQSKVTDPTGAGCEEIGVSPIVKSFGKLSVEDEPDSKSFQTPCAEIPDSDLSPKELPKSPNTNTGNSYTDKLSYATSTITDRAISAKNAVASKLGYGGANTGTVTDPANETERVANRGIETSEGDKLSYTSTVTNKAISAKNAVASKLGYGGANTGTVTDPANETEHVANKGIETSECEANKGYGAAVSEKLSPVYNKVAGAGTTIMSKFTGTGSGAGTETTERGGSDGGVSVTEYLSEKLKPGEEDKALSDVISGTLYKRKDEKSAEGKETVRESEEVAKTLGTGDEQNQGNVSGELKLNSGNAGVVERVKSWFGKGNEEGNAAAASPRGETRHEQEEIGERRLQESSN